MEPLSETPEPTRTRPEPPATRVGMVVLTAVLTEVALIAALGNQWITPKIFRAVINERSHLVSDLKASLITYNWRLAPADSDTSHIWLSQVLLIAITLALSALFTAVVVRGPASFARILLTCWLAVTVATVLGAYARGLTNETLGTSDSRLRLALFSTLGPNTVTLFSGLVMGLIAGLVAAIVATKLGGRAEPVAERPVPAATEPAYVAPEQPPPFFPDPPRTRPSPTGQPTTKFPRPPDDEDLGHEHD